VQPAHTARAPDPEGPGALDRDRDDKTVPSRLAAFAPPANGEEMRSREK